MKKHVLLILAALLAAGCDPTGTTSSTSIPYVAGVYDVTLVPSAPPSQSYIVTVERGGISGNNQVSVSGPLSMEIVTVNAGSSVDLGTCGLWILFGNTTGFNLVAGDNWLVNVVNGRPGTPVPGDTVDSTVGRVSSGGQDSCAAPLCDGSALASAVPSGQGAGGQWLSVRLSQTAANLSAMVAEQHILSLNLGLVTIPTPPFFLPALTSPGDTVTLTFRRRMIADGVSGDFFRAVAASGIQSLDAEYLFGASVASADTTVTFNFISGSSSSRVDFIVGLSDQGEEFILDSVKVLNVSTGNSLTEGFESGPGVGCGPSGPNAVRWTVRGPVWEVGSLCVSVSGALAGTYSAHWRGGSYRQVSGSVLASTEASSSLSSLLGGGDGGDLANISGQFLEAWEPVWSGYFTSFFTAEQTAGNLVGTFKGESLNHACVEEGQLTASLHRTLETDLSSRLWIMRLEGAAAYCQPRLVSGDTIAFGDTLGTAAGDTIQMMQIGQVLRGETVIDNYTNNYSLNGTVSGSLVTISLRNAATNASASSIGVINNDVIQGSLTGSLVFDSGRVCRLSSDSSLTVHLVPP
jgi:hypothetical protein